MDENRIDAAIENSCDTEIIGRKLDGNLGVCDGLP